MQEICEFAAFFLKALFTDRIVLSVAGGVSREARCVGRSIVPAVKNSQLW